MDALSGTIHGITEEILRREIAEVSPELVERVSDRLRRKLAGMPSHLRLGMTGLTLGFSVTSRVTPGGAGALLERWRTSTLPALPDFVAFYEKMGLFTLYSELEEAESAGDGDR